MAKARSPNYPAASLPVAIERARALYKQDGKAAVPVAAAVKAWGYTSLNGRSLRAVGALRAYGLVDYPAPKTVKLTSRALTILLEPEDSERRRQAIMDAAHEPPVFGELMEKYSEGFPSDQSMVSDLVRGNFTNEAAARKLIAVFRETLTLAFADPIADTSTAAPEGREVSFPMGNAIVTGPQWKTGEKSMPDVSGQDARPYDLTLALMGGVQATLRVPRQMTEDNYRLLTTLLDANLKAMKDALVVKQEKAD